ncbi:LacI family DNA-binding transcriptional regulator [Novosphingobium sp. M1R2S20]|uniref:LacI family DNA-binding transcriptional regulator n=1 Tax=Novosphingobium rhizovicinum TaxID=3228928 RepID=A0ABV3RF25_9SPHN
MVAAHAGVSPMSVSNVLNGQPTSVAMRAAVHAAIEELGYVPNLAARQLASAAPTIIGLLHANDEHPVSAALLNGALTAATRLGVQLLLEPIVFPELASGWEKVAALRRRGAAAILLPPTFGEMMASAGGREEFECPVICVGAADEVPTLSTVRIDEFAAAQEVTEGLIARGHRRIGFLRLPAKFPAHAPRWHGYLAAMRRHGVTVEPELIAEGEFWFQEGLAAGGRLLDLPDPPTAIFASNDEMATGVLAAAQIRRVAVPKELSVVGFEDTYFAQNVWPPLTSVKIPMSAMSSTAVERLLREIRSVAKPSPSGPTSVVVPHTINWRASTGD